MLECIECYESEEETRLDPDTRLCNECFELYHDEPGRLAAAKHLGLSPSDFEDDGPGGLVYNGRHLSYRVLEVGQQWDDYYKAMGAQFLDELVLAGVPETVRHYFDEERWLEDNESNAGCEDEVTIWIHGDPYHFYILQS